MGFIRVANEAMCRPIRALTQMRGYDVTHHVLACFGGAGGQHACAIARSLGMKTIFIHRYSGVLSAVGIGLAEVVAEEQVKFLLPGTRCQMLMLCPRHLTSDAAHRNQLQKFWTPKAYPRCKPTWKRSRRRPKHGWSVRSVLVSISFSTQ